MKSKLALIAGVKGQDLYKRAFKDYFGKSLAYFITKYAIKYY